GPWGHPIPRISAMICLLLTLNRILKKPPAPLSVAQTSSRTGRTHQGLCLLPRALLAAFFSILLYGFLHHCALIPTRPPRPREIRAAVPTKTTIRTPITVAFSNWPSVANSSISKESVLVSPVAVAVTQTTILCRFNEPAIEKSSLFL